MKTSTLKTLGAVILLSALVGLVLAGFASIMSVRLDSGNVYAHYSTMRSDPLGSRALFESFDKLEAYQVERNISPLATLNSLDSTTTLFLLGVSRGDLARAGTADMDGALDSVKKTGARLVIVTNPEFVFSEMDDSNSWLDRREESKEKQDAESEESEGSSPDEEETEDEETTPFGLLAMLGVTIADPPQYESPEGGWEVQSSQFTETLPRWRSPFYFDKLDPEWKTIATVDHDSVEAAVVIERPWGKNGGTIVLTSDAYFASNEALWKDLSDGSLSLLLWLAGENQRLIFDETIHNAMEGGGIMKLIKKHRFHGFFIGLIIFVALLAWKSGTTLVPGNEQIERGLRSDGTSIAGEASSSGFVRLLKRSVPARQLLSQCVATWRQSAKRITPDQEKVIATAVAAAERDPKTQLVPAYRSIVEAMRRK